MNDEIKVGDTVESDSYQGSKAIVIAVDAGWLWLNWGAGGSHFTVRAALWRKVKPPTPCPEGWANVYPEFISWHSTKEAAVSSAARRCIGVLHLLPSGDTEFIRTEEL